MTADGVAPAKGKKVDENHLSIPYWYIQTIGDTNRTEGFYYSILLNNVGSRPGPQIWEPKLSDAKIIGEMVTTLADYGFRAVKGGVTTTVDKANDTFRDLLDLGPGGMNQIRALGAEANDSISASVEATVVVPRDADDLSIAFRFTPGEGKNWLSLSINGETQLVFSADSVAVSDFRSISVPVNQWAGQVVRIALNLHSAEQGNRHLQAGQFRFIRKESGKRGGAFVKIGSPKAGLVTQSDELEINGTAAARISVGSVRVRVNDNAEQIAVGLTKWSTVVGGMVPGPNVIRVRALDSAGEELANDNVIVILERLAPLEVNVNDTNGGTVDRGFLGVTQRRIGVGYTITAKPKRGYVFAGWEGTFSAQDSALRFLMPDGASLVANFIPSPFTTRSGTYTAPIEAWDTKPPGRVEIALGGNGAFTGVVWLGGQRIALKGILHGDGTFLGALPKTTILLELSLSLGDGDPLLTGRLIAVDGDGSDFVAARSDFNAKTSPTQQAGAYTAALRPLADADLPSGIGFWTANVSKDGSVRVAGLLGDGSPFSAGGKLTADNRWAVHTLLYGKRGWISGGVNFSDTKNPDVDGALLWFKPEMISAWHPAGFSGQIEVEGSRYTSPPIRPQMLDLPSGQATLAISGGNLATSPADKLLAIDTKNKVTLVGNEKFTMALAPATGLFSGTFYDTTKKARSFRGVILQEQNVGVGLFKGNGESGKVELLPKP